jgi:capsule biosynthesis phosphatase
MALFFYSENFFRLGYINQRITTMPNTYVLDVDGTICQAQQKEDGSYDYANASPFYPVIERINELYDQGNTIIFFTARGMRTYKGNVKKIKEIVQPVLVNWLEKNGVKYHELIMGKPWGENVFYIDDRGLSLKAFTYDNPEFFKNIIKAENLI